MLFAATYTVNFCALYFPGGNLVWRRLRAQVWRRENQHTKCTREISTLSDYREISTLSALGKSKHTSALSSYMALYNNFIFTSARSMQSQADRSGKVNMETGSDVLLMLTVPTLLEVLIAPVTLATLGMVSAVVSVCVVSFR